MKSRKGRHMIFKPICINWQKWSRKNEVGENLSLPQMLCVFNTLVLTLVLVSGCDSPSSSNQHRAQSSGTPLPTIAARGPGSEQSFCTVDQTAWSGPDNVRQVDSAVPPPVPSGLIGGYSVGDFNAPCIMPKVGVVRIEAFIQTKLAFKYFYGNDRNFNPEFDPADTKASIILDFTKGAAQVIISPTCHVKVNAVTNPDCTHAYALNEKNGLLVNWFRWKVDPAILGFPLGTEFLTIQYAFKIAALRADWKWFAQHGIPPINGLIHFAFEPGTGSVCLKGTIDNFPATAVHQVHYDSSGKATAITLARHEAARLLGPAGLTDPFHWTETHVGNQCGQSLTGSSPANPLGKVDWTHVVTESELGCNGTTPGHIGPNLGVEVDAKQFADVTGDDNAEAFVAVACVGSTESWPDRLEVFDGASDPDHPRRIATLLDYQDGTDGTDGYGLRIQSITISGKMVTIVSRGWTPGECFACGDQRITDTFTWNGSSFTRGSRLVTQIT